MIYTVNTFRRGEMSSGRGCDVQATTASAWCEGERGLVGNICGKETGSSLTCQGIRPVDDSTYLCQHVNERDFNILLPQQKSVENHRPSRTNKTWKDN
jgi:hypothetical protein